MAEPDGSENLDSEEFLSDYPGGDLVRAGLRDLGSGLLSEQALLVALATERLRGLGLNVPDPPPIEEPYEHALYHAINQRNPAGAHAEYNALISKIVSFAQAYGRTRSRDAGGAHLE
jgi:hypothetical protein